MSNPATRIPFAILELAKHAPISIPDWFEPFITSERPKRPTSPEPGRDHIHIPVSATEQQAQQIVDDHQIIWTRYHKAVHEWVAESNRRRFLQWPLAWAKMVLEEARTINLMEPDDPDFEVFDDAENRIRQLTNALMAAAAELKEAGCNAGFVEARKAANEFGLFEGSGS